MSWTTPRTWVASELVTANLLNAHVRDNLAYLKQFTNNVTASYSTETTHSTSYSDTGLTASITPVSAASHVLVIVTQAGVAKSNNGFGTLKLVRNSTDLKVFGQNIGYNNAVDYQSVGSVSTVHVDAPATTSATTYKTQGKCDAGGVALITQDDSSVSTIFLMEIQ